MTELVTVLWRPWQTMAKIADDTVRLTRLVLTVLAIDCGVSLALLPQVYSAASAAMLKNPALPPSTRWIIMAFSLLFSSLINLALALFAALLVYLSTFVFKGTGSYRKIFEVVLIGSAPLILMRIVRTCLRFQHSRPELHESFASLGLLVPVTAPHLARIASVFNVADVWSLVLFGVGYSIISGLRRSTSWTVVVALWVLLQAVSIRIQAMTVPS